MREEPDRIKPMPDDESAKPESIHWASACDCPWTCSKPAIAEGDGVRLGSRLDSIVIHADLFIGLQPDVAVVKSQSSNGAFAESIGIDALVNAKAGPPSGGAVFHEIAIRGRPA